MATAVVQPAASTSRILIVEDEGIIAHDIRRTLEELGYAVTGMAASGPEALHLVENNPPDLVLMDICLRGDMDGIQAADSIRARFQLPVVYLTAHTDKPTLDRAKASEPFGYIVKPFTSGDLKVSIEIALQRHRLQRQIGEREALLSAVLRSIGDAVIVSDPAGRVTFFNTVAEELTGIPAAHATGQLWNDIAPLNNSAGPAPLTGFGGNSCAGPLAIQFTTGTLRRSDGSERLVISSVAPVRKDAAGESYGCITVLRDVSDFKKTEQALKETNWFLTRSNEHLTALSHSLTHDLQESLRAVSSGSKLLAGKKCGSLTASQQEYLQYITEGCTRMEQLLSSLLEYYRADIAWGAAPSSIPADEALQEAVLNLQEAIHASGANVHAGGLPEVYAHPAALTRILQNLIGNAINYRSEAAPKIDIAAVREGTFWKFTVSDNGSGFEQDQSEKIFELFQRGHGRHQSGSGVGLAMCRRLVEQYGGKIWAESLRSVGSRFHFTLPGTPWTASPGGR